uniref:BHLH domain-containing protein n=1 Tax=Panagrolaimus sp. JU765 TaxID=591449 RepID=A0AC34PXX3_9BILA
MTFFPDPRSGIQIPSYPNTMPSAFCRQDQQESRKPKKPEMEKKRRNRMNTAIDNQKEFLIRYNEASSSKLEKADILEKTVVLIKKLETTLMNNSANFAQCLVQQLIKTKTSAETMKTVVEALRAMPLFLKGQNVPIGQNTMSIPPPGRSPMMPPNPAQFVCPPPSHPSAFMFNPNVLLAQQQHLMNIRIGNPLMTSTPKHPSYSAPPPHSSSTTPVLTSKTSTSSVTDSRPPSADEFSSEDEEIDIENVDENDDTYSPSTTPSDSPRRGLKRSSSSMATDDSGIERSPKRSKNSFFIDVNTLFYILISNCGCSTKSNIKINKIFASFTLIHSKNRQKLLEFLQKLKNLNHRCLKSSKIKVKVEEIKEEVVKNPPQQRPKKKKKKKPAKRKRDHHFEQPKMSKNPNNQDFESIRVAVEYLASFFYNDCTVLDSQVDQFALKLSNLLIELIYSNPKYHFYFNPKHRVDTQCHCSRSNEIILDINVDDMIPKILLEAAQEMDLTPSEFATVLPRDMHVVISSSYCFRIIGNEPWVFMHKGLRLRCHLGGEYKPLYLDDVLKLMPPDANHVYPYFVLISELGKEPIVLPNDEPNDSSNETDHSSMAESSTTPDLGTSATPSPPMLLAPPPILCLISPPQPLMVADPPPPLMVTDQQPVPAIDCPPNPGPVYKRYKRKKKLNESDKSAEKDNKDINAIFKEMVFQRLNSESLESSN